MSELTTGTMARAAKGPVAPPPLLDGPLGTVADAVTSWPGIIATAHWDLYRPSRIDGVDFYWREEELGHIHLDGWVHLASGRKLSQAMMAKGLAQRFPYHPAWVEADIRSIGVHAAVALLRRNYERLSGVAGQP